MFKSKIYSGVATGLYSLLFFVVMGFIGCKQNPDPTPQVAADGTKKDEIPSNAHEQAVKSDLGTILFFGNSLTAGYGLDEEQSFPALVQKRIDSLGLHYTVVNAGLSGETTSGGKNRIDWVLKQKVDVFVLELGANDVLRGLDLKETESNLKAILDKVKQTYPDAKLVIAGMNAPPNMGNDYTRRFAAIFPKLAKEYNALLIPFLLEGVAARPELNLTDGKHPNAEGQKLVRDNVWKVIGPLLK